MQINHFSKEGPQPSPLDAPLLYQFNISQKQQQLLINLFSTYLSDSLVNPLYEVNDKNKK